MLSITQLQPGIACIYNNKPYIVLESSHEKQGRGSGVQHVTMRCIFDGTTLQQNFKGNVSLDEAHIERTQGRSCIVIATACIVWIKRPMTN